MGFDFQKQDRGTNCMIETVHYIYENNVLTALALSHLRVIHHYLCLKETINAFFV